ncbi:MAG TPA: hypothetical protein VFH29_08400, partial [Anaerolineales bacterium]|nr:hypothetical protein [Anaerolineales bacterium]
MPGVVTIEPHVLHHLNSNPYTSGRAHHSRKHPSGTFGTQRDHPAKSREKRASRQLDRVLAGRALSAYGMLPRQRAMHIQEGTIPFRGYHTWYRVVGEQDQLG